MATSTAGLAKLAKALRNIPRTLAINVAEKVAPEITDQALAAFEAGQTVYGDARPLGKNGEPLKLDRTGKLKAGIKFTAIGTRVRAVLSVPYAKYNIRYGILPNGAAAIPGAWRNSIDDIAKREIEKGLG